MVSALFKCGTAIRLKILMIDWDTYQAAYQAADQKTKDTLHSSLISECVANCVTKHELDASNQKTLIQLFSEKTLSLLTDAQVTEEMRKEGIPSATVISNEISQCIATKTPAVADTSLAPEESPTNTTTAAPTRPPTPPTNPSPQTSPNQKKSLESEIAETEAALDAIPKMRTMAQDVQESPTHTSSQDELLNKDDRWAQKK
jgi:hypothetical protein